VKGLVGRALLAAQAFTAAHPDAVITSGKRGLVEQAQAMARNTVAAGRRWISLTYSRSDVRIALQTWLDAHPNAKTEGEIANGLLSVLRRFSRAKLAGLSKHLCGLAFDVQPVDGERGEAMKQTLRELAAKYGGKFLEREGGLIRWHIEFPEAA
jgi:hypothetical protein